MKNLQDNMSDFLKVRDEAQKKREEERIIREKENLRLEAEIVK